MKGYRRQTRRVRGGFTLLEVLLVLAILGVIAAMVVPQLLGRRDQAMIDATRANIKGFEDAAKYYAVRNNQYPQGSADDVVPLLMSSVDEKTGRPIEPYLEEVPLDAWQQPLRYEYPPSSNRGLTSNKPAIWSVGPDGQDNTDDDVTNWDRQR